MAKRVNAYYLSSETIDALKAKAQTVGASESELADLLLRFGLSQLRDDVARAHLEKKRADPGHQSRPLRKNERAVMAVLEAMTRDAAKRDGAFQFDVEVIAGRAGLYRKEGFLALNACALRGLVHSEEKTVQLPAFKKKTITVWWLASVADQTGKRLAHVAPVAVGR